MIRGLVINPPRAMVPPMCGRCLRRCDRIEEEYDPFMQRVVYTAVCHGERERVVLTEEELNVLEGRASMAMGTAFASTVGRLLEP